MLKNLISFLSPKKGQENRLENAQVLVAACSLFIEMARIDGEFSDDEKAAILEVMKTSYGLEESLAQEIMTTADKAVAQAVDVWHFTKQIRDHWNKDEQKKLVELLWRILFVDGHMDVHETYLLNKVGESLHLSQIELIEIKTKVLRERGKALGSSGD